MVPGEKKSQEIEYLEFEVYHIKLIIIMLLKLNWLDVVNEVNRGGCAMYGGSFH